MFIARDTLPFPAPFGGAELIQTSPGPGEFRSSERRIVSVTFWSINISLLRSEEHVE